MGLSYAQNRPQPLRERAKKPTTKESASTKESPSKTDVVAINYPEMVNLASFVDYVSQSLGIKIIYSDELKNQSVVFRPGQVDVPTDHLLDLLRSMLRMHDLGLVEGDVDGWLRIVQVGDLQRHVQEIREEQGPTGKSNRVITQVVRVAAEDMQTVVKHAKEFLSSPKASVIEVPEKGILIITDYESAVTKALEIIKLIDVSPKSVQVATTAPQHVAAKTIVEEVTKVLSEKAKFEGKQSNRVVLQADSDGSILLVGSEEAIKEAQQLIDRFDVGSEVQHVAATYAPKRISAARLSKLVETLVAPEAARKEDLRVVVDDETNRLYVTATPALQDRIQKLASTEDVATFEPSKSLRAYKPKNRLAREIMSTLANVLPNVTKLTEGTDEVASTETAEPTEPPGPNRPPSIPGPGVVPPMPPAQKPIEKPFVKGKNVTKLGGADFTLTCDDHTNSLIALGPREFHVKLKMLLEELDKRQPQVVIEMTLVAVTFNDSLSLAVELANEEKEAGRQFLTFSSFGLSDIDLNNGVRTFHPGGGLNGIIMGPHETPILLRAIAAHGNSHIMTTPKVVVSDNTSASISSVEEAPFTSINASTTVATTSFAGFESAGTTLSVTPHISQGDHLHLEYSFNFSNFTGSGSVGVPPPRTTNTFNGKVEIPDGYTVVVGGLVKENEADSVTEVPLLGRIPVIGVLFQSSDRARTKSRIYAFIRPTILRDDRFADLKLISDVEAERAGVIDANEPPTEYMWMR